MNALRWLAVLPAALGGAIAVDLGLVLVNLILTAKGDPGNPRWVQFVGSLFFGYFFVKIGTKVAPSHRRAVAITLCVLFLVLGLGIVAMSLATPTSDPFAWIVLCIVTGILSSCFAAFRGYHE